MARNLGAQPEAIVGGKFEGRNAEAINKNFETLFRRLRSINNETGAAHEVLGEFHSDATEATPVDGDLITRQSDEWARLEVGSEGQVLKVVSGEPAWDTDAHNLLSSRHTDTTADSPVVGDLITGQTGPVWARLAVGAANAVLVISGGIPTWAALVNANIDNAAAIAWSKISKVGSSLADLATRSAGDLNSGTLLDARLSANVPLKDAANTFSAQQTFTADNAIKISRNGICDWIMDDTSQGVDLRKVIFTLNSGIYFIARLTDDEGSSTPVWQIERSTGNTNQSGAIIERGRGVALGEWINVPFSAGDFTGNGAMTWTVASGDVLFNMYTLIGKTMIWILQLDTTSVGGTPNTQLLATVPGGLSISASGPMRVSVAIDAGALGQEADCRFVDATHVAFQRLDGAAWGASANVTYIYVTMILQLA